MKTCFSTLMALSAIVSFGSCEQDGPRISGESVITGVQNAEAWASPASGGRYPSGTEPVDMSGVVLDEGEVFSEAIIFANIPFYPGRYTLKSKRSQDDSISSYFYTSIGFDVPNSRFYLDESAQNFINVEIADGASNYIQGTFQAIFVRDPTDTTYTPFLPDTLKFTDGFFRVKLKE